jgi:hypothetical protein
VTTEFVSWSPLCTGGNETHGDSGYDGERPRGTGSGAPLVRGEGPWLSTELLDHGAWP